MAVYLDQNLLSGVVQQIKHRNKRIVLTHGAFDLYHIGHIAFLQKSKLEAEYLAVGLESDERIAKYKGYGRPIIPLEERIEVLLDNKSIDFVFSLKSPNFSNKYYYSLYSNLLPNHITYGKNYAFKSEFSRRKKLYPQINFQQISHNYDDVRSTTNIITKIKNPRKLN